jgi:hypothetical protein
MIDTNMTVIFTGTKTNEKTIFNSIIDGEHIKYDKNDNFIIILTGGDAEFLAKRLKNTIFANPNFLLESLNQTFQYNQQ